MASAPNSPRPPPSSSRKNCFDRSQSPERNPMTRAFQEPAAIAASIKIHRALNKKGSVIGTGA